jgi:hypothetical protein
VGVQTLGGRAHRGRIEMGWRSDGVRHSGGFYQFQTLN